MEILKQLLFNLAILVVLLYLFQTYQRNIYSTPSNKLVFIYFAITEILTMLTAAELSDEIRIDLRQIPLIIGGLYFGPLPGAVLLAAIIVIRAFFGINTGFWISIIIFSIQYCAVWLFHRWFVSQKIHKKIETAIFISFFSAVFFTVITYLTTHTIGLGTALVYVGASSCGAGILTAIIEVEKINFFLRDKAIKTEKIKAVSQMSASISHEVRNPLAAVKGFLQLLKDPGFNEEKRHDFIDIALLELARAEKTINDYLSFAKPFSSKIETIPLDQEISKVLDVINPMANMNSVTVNKSLDTGIFVKGDIHRFHQCLINLVKNSIEAMPGGGELNILLYQNGKNAFIHIIDSGTGMSEEEVRQLGEPYYSTKGDSGTGLGLMVSYGVIREMKGHIQVNSKKGEGTTFIISVPISDPSITTINEPAG